MNFGTKSDVKWVEYIGDFEVIEAFFSDKKEMEDWLIEFDRLINLRAGMESNALIKYHSSKLFKILVNEQYEINLQTVKSE